MSDRTAGVMGLALLLATAGRATSLSAAARPLNVLFYGNSFTLANDVPDLFSRVASAGGQTVPNYVDAAVPGQTLQYHYQNNLAPISATPSLSGKWDYVVLQENSTRPIDATNAPNYGPSLFLEYAQSLYGAVQTNSPNVKPLLFEAWARQPSNPDLATWYPGQFVGTAPNPYMAAACKMQSELYAYYYQARAQLGYCSLAPVGDAFEAMAFDSSLYQSDLYHESTKGSLMAAVLIYEQLYDVPACAISYQALNNNLSGGLSNYGISSFAEWTAFASVADSMTFSVPEPSALGVLVIGAGMLLCRQRTNRAHG